MSFNPKILPAVLLGAMLLGSAAQADGWRPEEFLKLDLSQAVLSPKLLGPPAQFEALPVQAKAEPAKAEAVLAKPAVKSAQASVRSQSPRRKLAPRRNPLDAQAADTRIQVWPCRSGAICNWKR